MRRRRRAQLSFGGALTEEERERMTAAALRETPVGGGDAGATRLFEGAYDLKTGRRGHHPHFASMYRMRHWAVCVGG